MNYETKSGFYPTAITGDNTFDAQLNIVDPMQIAETKPGITPGMVFSETQGWIPENSASVVGGLMPSPSINIQPEYVNTQTNIPSVEYSPRQIYTYNNQLTQQANSGMTLNELQEILKLRQRTPQGPAPTVDQIIAAIQSQYQPMQAMPMPEASQGAQRFVTNAGNFGPVEQIVEYGRSPVSQQATAMNTFVPGAFDINRTSYIATPNEAQIAARISGNYGGSSDSGGSGVAPMSKEQEAVFDFMNTPEGQSYKDAWGKANSDLISSVLPAVVPGLGLYNFLAGKQTNPITSIKQAVNAWQSARDAMNKSQAALSYYDPQYVYDPTYQSDVVTTDAPNEEEASVYQSFYTPSGGSDSYSGGDVPSANSPGYDTDTSGGFTGTGW